MSLKVVWHSPLLVNKPSNLELQCDFFSSLKVRILKIFWSISIIEDEDIHWSRIFLYPIHEWFLTHSRECWYWWCIAIASWSQVIKLSRYHLLFCRVFSRNVRYYTHGRVLTAGLDSDKLREIVSCSSMQTEIFNANLFFFIMKIHIVIK